LSKKIIATALEKLTPLLIDSELIAPDSAINTI